VVLDLNVAKKWSGVLGNSLRQFHCFFAGHDFLRVSEEAASENVSVGKGCKVGFCPLRAASLQTLEAGTVAFFLARLPGRELNARS